MKKVDSVFDCYKNHGWLSQPIVKILYFFKGIKWAFQRVVRGYSDYDCWNLDRYYSLLIANTINTLIENDHSSPSYLTEEEWDEELHKIVNCFELVYGEVLDEAECEALQDSYDSIEGWRKWHDITCENETIRQKMMEQGFDLLKKYYFDLWN